MDMNAYIPKLLTNAELEKCEGRRFKGRVLRVGPATVFNRWKLAKEDVPVITFEDGHSWIPNIGARRALTEAWGSETDGWAGRRMAIYLQSLIRTEKVSGRQVERLEKRVEPLADDGS